MSGLSALAFLVAVIVVGNAAVTVIGTTRAHVIPLGLGVIALVITGAMIPADMPLMVVRIAVLAVCVASLYYWKDLRLDRRALVTSVSLILAAYAVMILPALLGGPQFYSFRGNWWDHFNYLAGLEAVSLHRASAVRQVADSLAAAHPIALYGAPAIETRPAAVLVAAVFRLGRADVFAYAYSLLAMAIAMVTPVIVSGLSLVRERERPAAYYLIALSVPIGFWGQLLLDTSVWSHIVCLPVLAGIFYQFFAARRAERDTVRDKLASVLLYFAAFIVYPEATAVVVALLILTSLMVTRSVRTAAGHMALVAIAVLLSAAVDYGGSTRFFVDQVSLGVSSSGGNTSWFLYFFQPYFGYNFTDLFRAEIAELKTITQQAGPAALFSTVLKAHPVALFLPLNLVPILLGYYALVNFAADRAIALSAVLSLLLMVAGLIVLIRLRRSEGRDHSVRTLGFFLLACSLLAVAFLALGKIWELGKAFTFVMPLLVPVVFALMLRSAGRDRWPNRLALALVSLFLLASGIFAVQRIVVSAAPSGIGHSSPFPSVLHVEDKELFRYAVPAGVRSCRGVEIAETHPNRSLYLLLAARQYSPAWFNRPFSYEAGRGPLYHSPPDLKPDCRLQFARGASGDIMRVQLTHVQATTPASTNER